MSRVPSRFPQSSREVHMAKLGGQAETQGWLKLIPEALEEGGPFAFVFDVEPPRYVRELMDTLGVEVIVDPAGGRMEVRKVEA